MKILKEKLLSILAIFTIILFTASCGGSTTEADHDEMMDEDQTEVMENEDHMNEGMDEGEHMHEDGEEHMHDSTDHMHDEDNEHPQ